MKKLSQILILILVPFLMMGQTTIFSENCGTPSVTTSCATYTGWQNNVTLTYTASATSPDVRTTSPSSTYTGASGNGNIFFTNSLGIYVQISNINTTNYTNLSLSLGILKTTTASNGSELVIETSSDGTTYTALTNTMSTGTGTAVWTLVSPSGTIPATSNLRIRFRLGANNGTQFRIDDIKLVGCLIPTAPTPTYTTPACSSSVVTLPSNSYIETTSTGISTLVSPTITTTGTYYARTVSAVAGCTSIWSPATSLSVTINTPAPTISINPVSFTANHIGLHYQFTAHANYPFVWQISTNGGSTWNNLTIASPYSTNGDTLKIYPVSRTMNTYKYRIASTNGACITNSSVATLTTSTELPITLVSFTGNQSNQYVNLEWTTLTEINNQYFQIEKSYDGIYWKELGIIDGVGNSDYKISYHLIDYFPIEGTNYYRLKQVDYDGNYAYFNTISVDFDSATPNTIQYYDELGRQVKVLEAGNFYIKCINNKDCHLIYYNK